MSYDVPFYEFKRIELDIDRRKMERNKEKEDRFLFWTEIDKVFFSLTNGVIHDCSDRKMLISRCCFNRKKMNKTRFATYAKNREREKDLIDVIAMTFHAQ